MTLILDVDGVLLDWSGKRDNLSGFSDWATSERRFFSRWSPEQLKLISSSFSDIRWLTTWIDGGMVSEFTNVTGFGPHPVSTEPLERSEDSFFSVSPDHYIDSRFVIERGLTESLLLANWWKLNAVAALLHHGHLPDRVVWVDDDLPVLKKPVADILEHFEARDRFRLYAPTQIWTRWDIEEAAEWLNG
jgi:hypothetical protein